VHHLHYHTNQWGDGVVAEDIAAPLTLALVI
jgi:hypothetical protein